MTRIYIESATKTYSYIHSDGLIILLMYNVAPEANIRAGEITFTSPLYVLYTVRPPPYFPAEAGVLVRKLSQLFRSAKLSGISCCSVESAGSEPAVYTGLSWTLSTYTIAG
jgi:hypothetical protein